MQFNRTTINVSAITIVKYSLICHRLVRSNHDSWSRVHYDLLSFTWSDVRLDVFITNCYLAICYRFQCSRK
jgi:hypothetical protein